jgi:hypothetical protein
MSSYFVHLVWDALRGENNADPANMFLSVNSVYLAVTEYVISVLRGGCYHESPYVRVKGMFSLLDTTPNFSN